MTSAVPRRTLAAGVLAAALLAGTSPSASAGIPLPIPAAPAPPTSDHAFYTPPSPLPAGKPGDVIKTEPMTLPLYPEARATRLMYLSRNVRGERVRSPRCC